MARYDGTPDADYITGNVLGHEFDDDEMYGYGENDFLDGWYGNDYLNGGTNNDTLLGYVGSDKLFGLTGDDQLYGEADNDILDGGKGNDWLDGGDGLDTASYATAMAGVAVFLESGNGQATGAAGSDTLVNIENLTGSKFNDTFISDFSENSTFNGGNGDDYIEAGHIVDCILNGGAGNDVLLTGNGFGTLNGGTGNDRLEASDDFSVLNGGAGDDILVAVGVNTMNGGAGADTLSGDYASTYDYNAVSDSPAGAGMDTIDNFVEDGAQIDLHHIDAIPGGLDDPFAYIGASTFPTPTPFTATGQLRYVTGVPGVGGLLQGNTDTDAAAEFEIALTGTPSLHVTDLVL